MKKIVVYPNKKLFKISSKIYNKNKILKIVSELKECLLNSNGVGISSPQIGYNKRIFLFKTNENKVISFINPILVYKSKECFNSFEGCLSIPGFFSFVKRSSFIVMKYTSSSFKRKRIFLKGLFSACAQHEIDHLNGILINSKA
ncbi:Peptide deformylase [Candidatus Vidania fulgoroideae]|nr:Peptide deformylase [Candidatus Vidania fulgoroideae]